MSASPATAGVESLVNTLQDGKSISKGVLASNSEIPQGEHLCIISVHGATGGLLWHFQSNGFRPSCFRRARLRKQSAHIHRLYGPRYKLQQPWCTKNRDIWQVFSDQSGFNDIKGRHGGWSLNPDYAVSYIFTIL